jgi:hypothetical protein
MNTRWTCRACKKVETTGPNVKELAHVHGRFIYTLTPFRKERKSPGTVTVKSLKLDAWDFFSEYIRRSYADENGNVIMAKDNNGEYVLYADHLEEIAKVKDVSCEAIVRVADEAGEQLAKKAAEIAALKSSKLVFVPELSDDMKKTYLEENIALQAKVKELEAAMKELHAQYVGRGEL